MISLPVIMSILITQVAFVVTSTVLVPELVAAEGYPIESHYVTTTDGYILNIHRIPHGKTNKTLEKVAYLQHGILQSSSNFVLYGPGKSLAYILADEGYDVWMGNSRGNFYSRNHTTLDPDTNSTFWQFSWNEVGSLDLPATIDYVLEQTGNTSIYYVGHSQGTTVFYVMGATRPEYNDKIKVQVSLAPTVFLNHMISPVLRILAFFEEPLYRLSELFGVNELLPADRFLANSIQELCSGDVGTILCENILFVLFGISPFQMNITELPLILKTVPAGCSTKEAIHFAQLVNSGKFCQYDLGNATNIETYGESTPPDYDLSNITTPSYIIHSKNDWVAVTKDVDRLAAALGNLKGKYLVDDDLFNHSDFIFGINAPALVYSKIVSLLSQH
ncbi:hypothetical protein JTB14_025077 [Gonioctena quinquepunctata]|nr:hypothetical protein JTB14_025077 [Gonioctena quinquepunctata]